MSKPEQPVTVLVLHETVAQSISRDAVTLVTLLSAVVVGVWVGSSALQWIGGLMWVVWTLAKASKAGNRMTPQQAADFLAERFNVRAQP